MPIPQLKKRASDWRDERSYSSQKSSNNRKKIINLRRLIKPALLFTLFCIIFATIYIFIVSTSFEKKSGLAFCIFSLNS